MSQYPTLQMTLMTLWFVQRLANPNLYRAGVFCSGYGKRKAGDTGEV